MKTRTTQLMFGIATAAALALGLVSLVRATTQLAPAVGVEWAQTSSGVQVIHVQEGGSGEAAGLEVGDVVRTADGHRLADQLPLVSALWESFPGAFVELGVARGDEELTLSLAVPRRTTFESRIQAYLWVVGLIFLALGTYLGQRLPERNEARSFYAFSLTAFVMLAFTGSGAATPLDWMIYVADHAAYLTFPPLLLLLCRKLIHPVATPRLPLWARTILWTPLPLLFGMHVWSLASGRLQTIPDPLGSLTVTWRLERAYWAAAALASMLILVRGWFRATPAARRRLATPCLGVIVALGPVVLGYLVPLLAIGETAPAGLAWSTLSLVFLPWSLTTGVLRLHLSDLELFLKRSLAFTFGAGFLLALYAAVSMAVSVLLAGRATPPLLLPGVGIALTALAYPRVRTFASHWLDRIQYRKRFEDRQTLLGFARELNADLDLDRMVRSYVERIASSLGVGASAIYLRQPDVGLELAGGMPESGPSDGAPWPESLGLPPEAEQREAIRLDTTDSLSGERGLRSLAAELAGGWLFPMRVRGECIGALVVGPRWNGEALNAEDVDLLVALVAQASSAFVGARLHARLKDKSREAEALRDYNQRILESTRVGILVVGPDQNVVGLNAGFEKLFSCRREDVVGQPLRDQVPRSVVEALRPVLNELQPRGTGVARLDRVPCEIPGLGQRLLNLTVSELSSTLVGEGARVVTVDDITEQVRTQEQLAQQERLASLGLLASGVAHEVNTPLTGISSYTQMLLEEADAPNGDVLRKIEKQTERASQIVSGLLSLAREDGSMAGTVDLNQVVLETLDLFEPHLRGTGIAIERRLGDALPPLPGHRGKVQQALLNLLMNARDALPDGGTIGVCTGNGGDGVHVEVSDDGTGIAPEHLSRIYDPFFTTKSPGRGTGLGLSVAYGIVKEHGGRVDVTSEAGIGTTFRLELPTHRTADAAV